MSMVRPINSTTKKPMAKTKKNVNANKIPNSTIGLFLCVFSDWRMESVKEIDDIFMREWLLLYASRKSQVAITFTHEIKQNLCSFVVWMSARWNEQWMDFVVHFAPWRVHEMNYLRLEFWDCAFKLQRYFPVSLNLALHAMGHIICC